MTAAVPAQQPRTLSIYENDHNGHRGFMVSTSQDNIWVSDEHAASIAGYILEKVGEHERHLREHQQAEVDAELLREEAEE